MSVRMAGCRACEQITSGDCGMHGPVFIPTAPYPQTPTFVTSPMPWPAPAAALVERATPDIEPRSVIADVLVKHWLLEMRCNHELRTDTAVCACGIYRGQQELSVGAAVRSWANHVADEISTALSVIAKEPK